MQKKITSETSSLDDVVGKILIPLPATSGGKVTELDIAL
jgi:hypothetical protein